MRFSQRIGKTPVKTVLQVESMDDDLKNSLWNIIIEDFFETFSEYSDGFDETPRGKVFISIWREIFKRPIDTIPRYSNTNTVVIKDSTRVIREWFFREPWYKIYDFIEFIIPLSNRFTISCNNILEKEVSAYRIIKGQVIQITTEGEIAEIEEALTASDEWKAVNTHLTAALNFLADRKNPDYRNSIKESISAVESLCLKIGGNTNGKFGDALTEIERKIGLHGSLKRAFTALYGYASDEGGIRHALTEEGTTPTFEDAKFMLVTCSAFINYLKAKMLV